MNNNYENAINNRYDFVFLYDVENGNPNGDPDAGNMPRIDPETGHGIVTDVCIKRKIRNYVEIRHGNEDGFDIYVRQDAVLNTQDLHGLNAANNIEDKKDKASRSMSFRSVMCSKFFDIRTFGAVMTTATKKDNNLSNVAGQVRGPVQISFGKSIEPIVPRDITITRMAVATEKEKTTDNKDNMMGRKSIIPYALYRQEGFISSNLARSVTGFSDDDLEKFWDALIHMFEEDRSAARGKMALRELIVFKHQERLGNAPAHKLFERVRVERKDSVTIPRAYSDYVFWIDDSHLPASIEIIRKYSDSA
jgi:CRISPR-associated protein Csd2